MWWIMKPIVAELKSAREGMDALQVARDLCHGLDTVAPCVADLQISVERAGSWIEQHSEAYGKRQVERLLSASRRVLELRMAMLRGDQVAVEMCLDINRPVEPLVREDFDAARMEMEVKGRYFLEKK